MKHAQYDVLIVGGGLVGAALALSLRRTALNVALVEGRPPAELPAAFEDWDARVYAISRASQRLLERCGAWSRLPADRLGPVSAMQVHGDKPGHQLAFSAIEQGADCLAYILENRQLQAALWDGLNEMPNLTIVSPAQPQSLQFSPHYAELSLSDGQHLSASLVVGADGAQSWVRRQLHIEPRVLPYHQFGVVANFACERPHYGVARQWFRHDGILAWLPLAGQRMSMVWSCGEALKNELLALDAAELCQRVARAGQMELGEFSLLTPAQAFPLRLQHVPELVRERVALVGDAAHTVHPLAGQGVNLGFGDVAVLADLLAGCAPGRVGDLALLRRFERERRETIYLMQGVCHGLQKLFANQDPVLASLRNLGLGLTNRMPWLKRQLIRHAMDA